MYRWGAAAVMRLCMLTLERVTCHRAGSPPRMQRQQLRGVPLQEVARYIEGANRSLGQRQAQERAVQAGLQDARKALGEQSGMMDTVAALKGQLQQLREALQAQASTQSCQSA